MSYLSRYSRNVQQLWDTINPAPTLCEYPADSLAEGTSLKFTGMHVYHPVIGDLVYVVSALSHEYTFAHELMHVVLRREHYPHLTFRDLGFDPTHEITQFLESVILHPVLNNRLNAFGISVPPEYEEQLIGQLEKVGPNYTRSVSKQVENLPLWSLRLSELAMRDLFPRQQLRERLKFPEALELADNISHRSPGFFASRILFPPPPFWMNEESPAHDHFVLALNIREDDFCPTWEIEISSVADGMLCWSRTFLDSNKSEQALKLVRTALDTLGAEEFADFCERLFSTVVLQPPSNT